MQTFSIKEAFNRAWELFKAHKKVLIVSTIIMIVISAIGDSLQPEKFENYEVTDFLISLVFYVIGLFIQVGILKVVLSIIDGGSPVINEIFSHGKLVWKYFVASFAYGFVVFLGILALVIPGLYLMMRYLFVPLLVIDKGLSIKEAFKESSRMTDGVKLKLVLLMFSLVGLIILGVVALVVGLLVAIPVASLMYGYTYRKLSTPVGALNSVITEQSGPVAAAL